MGWLGTFVRSTDSIKLFIVVRDTSRVLTQADGSVTLRSWGDAGVDLTTTADPLVSLTVTDATNANPIVVTTSAVHGLRSGMRVTISGVLGNTNANGTHVITVLSTTTFSIPVAGNGAYTSGGTVNRTGLYYKTIACTSLAAAARTLTATYAVSGSSLVHHYRFQLL